MEPRLIDVPERLETERLILRAPRPGDGPRLNAAVCASVELLRLNMPWAQVAPSLDESEAECRRLCARFLMREDLTFLMILRQGDGNGGSEGEVIGGTGLHRIDWTVRRFEIGYWQRSGFGGRGHVGEAVRALERLAFDRLLARRVEIRMDPNNPRSWRVAERAGYTLEGTLRQDSLTPAGEPRDTRVYSKVRGVEEAAASTDA